jgi:polyferredoxin
MGKKVHILRGKLLGYAAVLIVICSLFVVELATRVPLALDIIRDRNTLARETNQGLVENVYTLKILNKSQFDAVYRLSVTGLSDYRWQGESEIKVAAAQVQTLPISIAVDPYDLNSLMTDIEFVIELVEPGEDKVELRQPSRFFNKR